MDVEARSRTSARCAPRCCTRSRPADAGDAPFHVGRAARQRSRVRLPARRRRARGRGGRRHQPDAAGRGARPRHPPHRLRAGRHRGRAPVRSSTASTSASAPTGSSRSSRTRGAAWCDAHADASIPAELPGTRHLVRPDLHLGLDRRTEGGARDPGPVRGHGRAHAVRARRRAVLPDAVVPRQRAGVELRPRAHLGRHDRAAAPVLGVGVLRRHARGRRDVLQHGRARALVRARDSPVPDDRDAPGQVRARAGVVAGRRRRVPRTLRHPARRRVRIERGRDHHHAGARRQARRARRARGRKPTSPSSTPRPASSARVAEFDEHGRLPERRAPRSARSCGAIPGSCSRATTRTTEATAERSRNGWYWSGDLGYRDHDGDLLLRRAARADWIRVDGENFAAAPIERIIGRHPDVARGRGLRRARSGHRRPGDGRARAARRERRSTRAEFGAFLAAQRRPRHQVGAALRPHRRRAARHRRRQDREAPAARRGMGPGRAPRSGGNPSAARGTDASPKPTPPASPAPSNSTPAPTSSPLNARRPGRLPALRDFSAPGAVSAHNCCEAKLRSALKTLASSVGAYDRGPWVTGRWATSAVAPGRRAPVRGSALGGDRAGRARVSASCSSSWSRPRCRGSATRARTTCSPERLAHGRRVHPSVRRSAAAPPTPDRRVPAALPGPALAPGAARRALRRAAAHLPRVRRRGHGRARRAARAPGRVARRRADRGRARGGLPDALPHRGDPDGRVVLRRAR